MDPYGEPPPEAVRDERAQARWKRLVFMALSVLADRRSWGFLGNFIKPYKALGNT